MKKFYETKLTQLSMLLGQAEVALESDPSMTMESYMDDHRQKINMALLEISLGGEFKPAKGGCCMVFHHKLPNVETIGRISVLLNDFIQNYELPAVQRWEGISGNALGIPTSRFGGVEILEKATGKTIAAAISGDETNAGYARMFLTSADVLAITASGKKFRKHRARMALIAGGIALLITAGVVTAVVIHHRRKDTEDLTDSDLSDGEITAEDLDDLDEAMDPVDDDEIPHVDLDD